MTATRTINCPNCGGVYEGDWSGVDCRTCGDFRNPVTEVADLLVLDEVVRFATGNILVAMTPEGQR